MSEGTFKAPRQPKVIELDCDKWWKVIGICLWSAASFGIYIGEYNMVQWSLQDKYSVCLGEQSFTYTYDKDGAVTGSNLVCNHWQIWSPLDILGMVIGTGAALFNSIGIWMVINNHFRLIQVKCRSNY